MSRNYETRSTKNPFAAINAASSSRGLAQLVERHPYKVDVVGSNPAAPTKFCQAKLALFSIFDYRPHSRLRQYFQNFFILDFPPSRKTLKLIFDSYFSVFCSQLSIFDNGLHY